MSCLMILIIGENDKAYQIIGISFEEIWTR